MILDTGRVDFEKHQTDTTNNEKNWTPLSIGIYFLSKFFIQIIFIKACAVGNEEIVKKLLPKTEWTSEDLIKSLFYGNK